MSDDVDLLTRWREGDQDAGNRLVRRHFSTVYCFFRSKIGEGAKDLTQRTFLACVEGRDRVREGTSFRAYLLATARHLLYSHYRHKQRWDKLVESGDVTARNLDDSPSRVLALREEQRLVLLALREIPLDLQIALELFYWEDMTMGDIASVLEIPEGTVKSRLHRARGHLKDKLAELAKSVDLHQTTADNLDRWARSLRGVLSDDGD